MFKSIARTIARYLTSRPATIADTDAADPYVLGLIQAGQY